MTRILRSSLAYKIVATTLALIFLSISVVATVMMYNLQSFEMEEALQNAHDATRTMAIMYGIQSDAITVDVKDHSLSGVRAEAMPPVSDNTLVDRVAASIKGFATVFVRDESGFKRVSTNVLKENGERAVGTKLAPDHPAQAALARGEAYYGPAQLFGKEYMTGYYPVLNSAGKPVGMLFVGISTDVYYAKIHRLQWLAVISGAAALLLCATVTIILNKMLLRPLGGLIEAVRSVSEGRLDREIPYANRSDEFGQIARALGVFRDNAAERVRLEAETEKGRRSAAEADASRLAEEARKAAEDRVAIDGLTRGLTHLAEGDVSFRIETAFAPHLEGLRRNFNDSVTTLQGALQSVGRSAAQINANAEEIRSAADDLSRRTEQQAASVEETAAALAEITTTVRKAADRAAEVGNLVNRTRAEAEKSGDVVRNAVEAMGAIEKSSSEIGNIIGVIDAIAFQTNLLALNAGVEAARAGDAGKGFAVVAQEVRELAQRSAKAAKEIKELINASNGQVQSGVELVGQAGQTLGVIANEVREISKHVNAIVEVTREQSSGLHEINTAVTTMDRGTQQNAAMVEESTAASHSLAAEAHELNRLLEQFKLESHNERYAKASATMPESRRQRVA
jgi:methyl-accepting chemotaxis protein